MAPILAMRQGEIQHCQLVLELSQFTAMDVEYSTGYSVSGGLIGIAAGQALSAAANANARRKAEEMARPQWRTIGIGSVVMTDRRLIFNVGGTWNSHYFDHLMELTPPIETWGVTVVFEGIPPVHLRGPAAPYLTVALCAAFHGTPWIPGVDYRAVFGTPRKGIDQQ